MYESVLLSQLKEYGLPTSAGAERLGLSF